MTENLFKILATGEVGKVVSVDYRPGDLGLTLELPDGALRFISHINQLEKVEAVKQ